MANEAGPSTSRPVYHSNSSSKPSNRSRYQANLQKYGTPLPILLPCSPLHPSYKPPSAQAQSYISSFLAVFKAPEKVEVPSCTGIYDPVTRSVWISDRQDMEILFNRGFFGKGTLSRSEPTWHARRLDQARGGESAAAEKIREKRRQERKQFKIDRAEAMLSAAKTAEAVLVSGHLPSSSTPSMGEQLDLENEEDAAAEDDNDDDRAEETTVGKEVERAPSPTPTTATAASSSKIDVSTLTPQTFLVRPTRPDANRNRGKNAFRRKPKPPPTTTATEPQLSTVTSAASPSGGPHSASSGPSLGVADAKVSSGAVEVTRAEVLPSEDEDEFDDTVVEDMEHLQLGLEEAWFLSTCLGVLKIYDLSTETYIPPSSILPLFLTPLSPTITSPSTGRSPRLLPDDPFLVSYACYHHFRTLGWVVKPGIKFACDWLLYRRGPVFSHAAFACVMIPVYDDPKDRETSPYRDQDWYAERMSWKWMNTIMRVNSLVQKNVVIIYVNIPALSTFPTEAKLDDGSLDPTSSLNGMQGLLERYRIREVSLSRFSPARRR